MSERRAEETPAEYTTSICELVKHALTPPGTAISADGTPGAIAVSRRWREEGAAELRRLRELAGTPGQAPEVHEVLNAVARVLRV